jgi:hypothetical protein
LVAVVEPRGPAVSAWGLEPGASVARPTAAGLGWAG